MKMNFGGAPGGKLILADTPGENGFLGIARANMGFGGVAGRK